MANFEIELGDGFERLKKAFEKFPDETKKHLTAAGEEASKVILKTTGLQKYPPHTGANMPPTPYYIRGRGMQRGGRRVPEYNDKRSERLGTQWFVESKGFDTVIGNRASYGVHVHGEDQAAAMGAKGWRKLVDVAEEKRPKLTEIYNGWVRRLLAKLGL